MCDNINKNSGKSLSEEELKDPLKNHSLYKQMLKDAIKSKKPIKEFVDEVWKEETRKPKILLMCGCYPPIPPV